MGLLTGSMSVTRFHAAAPPEPDFERAAFREIPPGSEVRESVGFVPYEPEAPYEVGARRWAFRVRVDTLRPDPTAVRERVKELVRTEMEMTGAPSVGPKKRKKLRHLAEEELVVRAAPRSKVIECAIDGDTLYVGSTAKRYLGTVVLLLRQAGVESAPKAPWLDRDLPELESEIVEFRDEGQSVYGCRFLRALVGDMDFMVEPETGRVKLATREARVTLAGEVLSDLHRYIDEGAEILSAKLLNGELSFSFDAPNFRVGALSLPVMKTDHWTELLDYRLGVVSDLYERLEGKFDDLRLSDA